MSVFTQEPPRFLVIGEKPYRINTDFRIMADFEIRINEADISDRNTFAEILSETISTLFIDKPDVPGNTSEIVSRLMWYFRCGKDAESRGSEGKKRKRCYDLAYDSEYIYAAFMQQYGIDLLTVELHWWTFRSLFLGLTEETEFVKIMQYRCTDISKIKSKDEKARIKKLQELFALKEHKIRCFASLADRNTAYREHIKQRYAEVQRLAKEHGGDVNG